MAINTDAAFERSTIGEGGNATDFGDTQKLLGVAVTEGKDGRGSCSGSRRPSVKSLNTDQFSHKSAGSEDVQSPPLSPAPEGSAQEPRTYMWLALLSCFCPAVPFNVFALYFSHAARSMIQTNDFEGARRLGLRSLLFSVIAITLGLGVILYLAITGVFHIILCFRDPSGLGGWFCDIASRPEVPPQDTSCLFYKNNSKKL